MNADEAVVIFTTGDPYTAQVVRAALEAEGIKVAVAGENQGGFPGVINEISLSVPAAQAEKARELIARHPKQAALDDDEE